MGVLHPMVMPAGCACLAAGSACLPGCPLPARPLSCIPLVLLLPLASSNHPRLPARPTPLALPTLQGLETYKGAADCAASILRGHGLRGLYRGMTSTVLRDIMVRASLILG